MKSCETKNHNQQKKKGKNPTNVAPTTFNARGLNERGIFTKKTNLKPRLYEFINKYTNLQLSVRNFFGD